MDIVRVYLDVDIKVDSDTEDVLRKTVKKVSVDRKSVTQAEYVQLNIFSRSKPNYTIFKSIPTKVEQSYQLVRSGYRIQHPLLEEDHALFQIPQPCQTSKKIKNIIKALPPSNSLTVIQKTCQFSTT
ncbi:CLUMA_CG009355, isoform A [Clunio marinus]|uniref:CLUMA_CG009355, isoform A n=1 Tax=Clunio marinus TaxID=568069 RepID=A0A1J1I6I9_9DIPT|nr:CLUMA_CG009355, isoform A [Clunio marinus]